VDFKGRANMASVKNFQLVHSSSAELDTKKSQEVDAEKDYILQVGKVCDNAV
jgi:Tub family